MADEMQLNYSSGDARILESPEFPCVQNKRFFILQFFINLLVLVPKHVFQITIQ